MGGAERRARHKEALRQRILDAARDVFVREGYESVSMRKIAAQIDYSPTTIYLHFKDKADLLDSLCEEIFQRIAQEFEPIAAQQLDPIQRLRTWLRAYVEFGLKHPDDYRVAFLIQRRGYLSEHSSGGRIYRSLRSTVEECMAHGQLRPDRPDVASQCLWAAVHGITSLLVIHPEFPWADRAQLIELAIDSTLRGLQ